MSRRALIYTRMSRDRAGAGLGVDRQYQDCVDLAERLNWDVVGHHSDNDLSAYSGKRRPGYESLLADLEAGRAESVVVWHTDRLHRRPVELEQFIAVCDPRGIITQTVKAGDLDLSTPSGRMVARMLGSAARYEVEHLIERAQAAKLQKALAGQWKGGRRPFGYEPDGVTVRPTEAEIVRRLSDDLLAGRSLGALARELNEQEIITSTGRNWKATEVRKLLLRPRNAGLMEHRTEIIGAAEWPAIVDEQIWRAVTIVLTDTDRRTAPPPGRRWLGSGLYLCGVCDGPLRIGHSNRNADGAWSAAYRCRNHAHVVRAAESLDRYVEAVIVARLMRPDAVHLLSESPAVDQAELKTERTAIQTRLDELVDTYTGGTITARQLERGTASLRERLADLDRAATEALTSTALDGLTGPGVEQVWPTLDLSRRRAVVDALAEVVVHRAARGRPPGWKPGSPYFSPKGIDINWRSA